MTRSTSNRARNPRGEGGRLRSDIVRAARDLLEQSGVEDAVTLRATARAAGVTAPSIYAHFADRTAVIEAVIAEEFTEFTVAVTDPMRGSPDPVERLRAGCCAYVRYAHDHPATYRILFTRHRPSALPAVAGPAADVFQVMVDAIAACVAAGRSRSTDPRRDAVALWAGLHGVAALPPAHPRFPWPPDEALVDQMITGLAHVR